VDDVYEHPQHPYTIGLLGALPHLETVGANGSPGGRLANIQGSPPDLQSPPGHCPFAPRCNHAFDHCWEANPTLQAVRAYHEAACFYDVEKGGPRHDA
jgi:oligopeptide/dipeptide ABC transporter ATP-binding protein